MVGNPPDNFGLRKKAIALSYRVDIDQPAKQVSRAGACCFGSLCAQIVIVKGNPGFAGQID